MKLREKLKTTLSINTDGEASRFAKNCEQIADEFAIGFAEWLGLNNYKFSLKYKSYQKKHINETMFYTTKQLLEIYKKEQGL